MKKIYIIILTTLIAFSCAKKERSTKFSNEIIENVIEIEIPNYLKKSNTNNWSGEKVLLYLKVDRLNSNDTLLISNTIKNLENWFDRTSTSDIDQNRKLDVTESISIGDFSGQYNAYSKRLTKGIIPVYSYWIFGAISDDEHLIKYYIMYSDKNKKEDFLRMKESIKKINNENKNENQKEIKKINLDSLSTEGYQVFEDLMFAVKAPKKLKPDIDRIELLKKQGIKIDNLLYSENNGIDYNITVFDISENRNNFSDRLIKISNGKFLDDYIENLKKMDLSYKRQKFKDFDAVVYGTTSFGLNSKAIFFVINNNAYMFQVSSKDDPQDYFNDFINTFINLENVI